MSIEALPVPPPTIAFNVAQVKGRGLPGERNPNAAFDSG